MSAVGGKIPATTRVEQESSSQLTAEQRAKQHQQEALLEKMRAKHKAKPRSYDDMRKLVRKYFEEKHFQMDPSCKERLRNTLDRLQSHIKVTTTQRLIERLESLSSSLALKFVTDSSGVFISADMFYVEVVLGKHGSPMDVKVHHECTKEAKSCAELANCLKRKDFADFKQQLDGLSSIYQLNAEPKVKKKAFLALQSMETDIYSIYQAQTAPNGCTAYDFMAQSNVGLVQRRRGGHPMRLVYFCPPFHLSNGTYENSENFGIEQVLRSESSIGASIKLEASSANKLQMEPTVCLSDKLVFTPLTAQNSMLMPAIYVLRLDQPLPVSKAELDELGLQAIPLQDSNDVNSQQPVDFLSMVIRTASEHKLMDAKRSLCVNLLDETHTYSYQDESHCKVMTITALQFTEPAQVSRIIAFLRKQTMLYKLLASTVRKQQGHYFDLQHTYRLTVRLISCEQITVDLINLTDDSLASVDFILTDNAVVSCVLYTLDGARNIELSEALTRRARRLHSIPQTIWLLHNKWRKRLQASSGQQLAGVGSSSKPGGMSDVFSSGSGAKNEGIGGREARNEPTSESLGEGNFEDNVKSNLRTELFSAVVMEMGAVERLMKLRQCTESANSTDNNMTWEAAATAIETTSKKYGSTWTDKNVLKTGSGGHFSADTGDDFPSTSKSCRPPPMPLNESVADTSTTKDRKSNVTPPTIASNKRAMEASALLGEAPKTKKLKKKRDDSPMGPPDKVASRQNSPGNGTEASMPAARKFPSPSSSPGQGGSSSNPTRPSPKHSPVYSSPKHSTASNSPKSPLFGMHSPKYGSSGKPSMSTLKNATSVTSLSPKGEKAANNVLGVPGQSLGSMLGRPYAPNVPVVPAPSTMTGNAMKREADKLNAVGPTPMSMPGNMALNTPLLMPPNATHLMAGNMPQQTPKSVASLSHLAAGHSNLAAAFAPHNAAASGSTAGNMDVNAGLRKGVAGGATAQVCTAVCIM